MKNIIFFFIGILFVNCSTSKKEAEFKKVYIEEFKFHYFKKCLTHGFDNPKELSKLFEIDKSDHGEFILGDRYAFIDSLAKVNTQKIKMDSINSIGKVAEGSEGKKVFAFCLCDYKSRWLDALAKAEYKKVK